MKKIICLLIVSNVISLGVLVNKVKCNSNEFLEKDKGTSSDLKQEYIDVLNYVRDKYNGYNSFKIVDKLIVEKCVEAQNYDQDNLQKSIVLPDNIKGDEKLVVAGNCSQTAATMLSWFYSDDRDESFNQYIIFADNFANCLKNGYYDQTDGGTFIKYRQNVVDFALENIGEKRDTWENFDNIYQGIVDFTNVNKAQYFGIKGHAMLAVGYLEVPVEYYTVVEKKFLWWKVTEHYEYHLDYEKFIIVCDGWYTARANNNSHRFDKNLCYSYYPIDKLGGKPYYSVIGVGD